MSRCVADFIIIIPLSLTGEGSAGELLGVEAVVAFLRVVLPEGQRPGTPRVLALEGVPESALILRVKEGKWVLGNQKNLQLIYLYPRIV